MGWEGFWNIQSDHSTTVISGEGKRLRKARERKREGERKIFSLVLRPPLSFPLLAIQESRGLQATETGIGLGTKL